MFQLFFTVKEKQEVIIQQFGRYVKTVKEPGLHFMSPLQSIARHVPMGVFQDGDKLTTKTKDDVFVEIPIKMHLQIIDSKKFHYDSSSDPIEQAKVRVAATVKQIASQMDFAELFETREALRESAKAKVGKEIEELYGIRIVDVIVDQPVAADDLVRRYTNVKSSSMDRESTRNNAEAQKAATITNAEADKAARILRGQGAAGERAAILEGYADQFNSLATKGISPEQAQRMIEIAMISDTIRDAASKGNLIITTTNTNDALAQFGAVSKAIGKPALPSNDDGEGRAMPAVKPPQHG